MRTQRKSRFVTLLLAVLAGAWACTGQGEEADGPEAEAVADTGEAEAYVRPSAEATELTSGDTIADHPSWTEQDWEVFRRTLRWAWDNGIDTLPIGERVARIGETFVGTAYIPQTLDPPGPERLIINLRALDCVTFVENMLAMARFVRQHEPEVIQDRSGAMEAYGELLTRIRYRGGERGDYPSRLHYFSEWIHDNEQKGFLDDVTREIGGVADDEPITFMTSHRDAYRQLAEQQSFEEVGRIEEQLNQRTRHYVPEARIADVADRIRTGDVIAATSTIDGLDVAHTGIALWRGETLHLMHAPLVGEDVQISERSLADRVGSIEGQDGIMVARPQEAGGGAAGPAS